VTDLTSILEFETRGGVAIVTTSHAPVNAIGRALRESLSKALAALDQDPHVIAVVLTGRGAHFSLGADIAELGASSDDQTAARIPASGPSLGALCRQIESMRKPVIAAMHGHAIGEGLELCLACHYRLADDTAHLAFPAVTFGMLPSGGATQRLPRLVGAEQALRLLLDAQPIGAGRAMRIGLIDEVVPATEMATGAGSGVLERAVSRAANGVALRRTMACRDGLRDSKTYFSIVSDERARAEGLRSDVWARIVDCVEAAALLSPDQGLEFETFAAQELAGSDASKALRHAFVSERRATRPPALPKTTPTVSLSSVAIWGASDFALEIAYQSLSAGLAVVMADPRREALDKFTSELTKRQTAAVHDGRMSLQAQQADFIRLKVTRRPEDFGSADIVFVSASAPPLPPGLYETRIILQGGGGPGIDSGAVAVNAALASGLMCEVTFGLDASPTKRRIAHDFASKLKWKTIEVGPGGPIELRLRQNLSAVIGHLGQIGQSREAVSQALLGFGIGVTMRSRANPMPAMGGLINLSICAGMANEGFRMLEEGVAKRPLDIDVVAVLTGFFPKWHGGPMFWAQKTGLLGLRAQLAALAVSAPELFTPAPLLGRMISENITLAMLNNP
jgi:3-hydroxyacyl-CoA dehydrogenase